MLSLANVSTGGKTNETVRQVSKSADPELDEIYAALAKQTEGMDFGSPTSPVTYTAKGEITYEGTEGLQSALKSAGVDSMILTLWTVDDTASQQGR